MLDSKNIRLSAMSTSDRSMDILNTHRMLDTPINKYEISCKVCGFPNIDKTSEPYYLAKGRDFSGVEVLKADLGNLFISNRVKRIFEIIIPNQCTYKKTFIYHSHITTKWWLAIPSNKVISGEVKDNIKRCKACNQPLHAHPGTQFKFWPHELEGPADIIKSKNWHSSDESDWRKSWIARDVYLSLRLISLLKKIAAKGIVRRDMGTSKFKDLLKAEQLWVEQSIEKIGDLINNIQPEINKEDINKFKLFYCIVDNLDLKVRIFEEKFKISANDITRTICSVKSGMHINVGFDNPFVVEEIENWKVTKTKIKLIAFAFDDFGNYLLFNPTDKNCPLYFYDHETMLYDLIQSSVLNLTAI